MPKPSLDGPISCGKNTCGSGEVCVIAEAGSQCGVNADAGVGPYQEYSWTCMALPRECDGVLTCDCMSRSYCDVSDDGRTLHYGCI